MSPDTHVYQGDLVSFPGPWSFQIGKSSLILVSDSDLRALADPDKVIDLSLTFEKREASLKQVCERARDAGHRTLIVAFDHFFAQYRPGQDHPRDLMPDSEEYIQRIAGISRYAEHFGLGLELSLLSPLEIGPAFVRETGEPGVWMHYRKGHRDPVSGAYSVHLWRQLEWTNNKGPIAVSDAGVRVFAFREERLGHHTYRVVRPETISEITETARMETIGNEGGHPKVQRVRIHGKGGPANDERNRVLVVQQYNTPEMDYFSPKALSYLDRLTDRYAAAGVKLNALYSDEMHIQQDWIYANHHDNGEFAVRYVTPALARNYAQRFGPEYADFARYLVYFCCGQEDQATDLSGKERVQHVFGPSPEDVRRTALFRSQYYRLLQDTVVDLFSEAKKHAERRMGKPLESRAHATWAESPTIDYWRSAPEPMYRNAYEYTSNFLWSNTVQQAASACYDYFKWGDFLTGNGTDHPECGWLDRNYYGLALACSIGILNEVPYAYCAHWGMPAEVSSRRNALVNAFGAAGSLSHGIVQDLEHREVDVLMLYPNDLVACEERFGSWMTQYGYANYITQQKLVERGVLNQGAIVVGGRRFTTLVALFEPFPSARLLELARELAISGGTVIWSGPPPVVSAEGPSIAASWSSLFGCSFMPGVAEGIAGPGREIRFEGALKSVPTQTILTDFLVDRYHPVEPRNGTEVVARIMGQPVGTVRAASKGKAVFLGFRPRDDQSQSLGHDVRTWFDILLALGAYPDSGRFPGLNDCTEVVSRAGAALACRFPNGTTSIARHLRTTQEGWAGGFGRNEEEDRKYLAAHPLPSDELSLDELAVNGRRVTYNGRNVVSFRLDRDGRLIGFAGEGCDRILIDGTEHRCSDRPVGEIAWAPVPECRRTKGGAVLQARVVGECSVSLPAPGLRAGARLFAEGRSPGSRGVEIPCEVRDGMLRFQAGGPASGAWLYAVNSM